MNTVFSNFPFIRYSIALFLGILAFLFFSVPINIVQGAFLLLTLIYGILFFINKAKYRSELGYLGILFLIAYGYLIAYWATPNFAKNHISNQADFDFYQAKIISLVEEKPRSWKATAEVEYILRKNITENATGKVLLYFDKNTVPKPVFQQTLFIKGKPPLVDGPKNPFEFNYKNYLKYQGIYHQHYLRDTSFVLIPKQIPKSFLGFSYAINNYCDSIFTQYFGEKTNLAVINAMVLGLRDDIDNDLIQAYSAAGAIHVLSVSGLHVGVIYVILVWVFGRLKRIKKGGNWFFLTIILVILWLYAAVTGFSSPVLRSTFMFSIILIAQNINRLDNSYNTVSISAFCLLLFNPFFIVNVGFLLSFLAVFGMIQIQPLLNPLVVIDKRKSWYYWLLDRLWKVSTVAIAAQIATLPITIYFFHQFPNYFLLANPLVILLSSIVLIGGLVFLLIQMLLSFLHLQIFIKPLAYFLEISVNALNKTVLFTEKLPGAISKYLDFTILEVVILYVLIFSILALIHTKKYAWVKLAALSTSLLIGLSVSAFLNTKNQKIVCIHAIPKSTVISIIDGNQVLLWADSMFINDRKNFNYRLNNFYAKKGIINVQAKQLPNISTVYHWKGMRFLILNDHLLENNQIAPIETDYLIIRNKKLRYFQDIKNKIAFKNLIIDGNISNFYANRLENEAAEDGVLAYSLLKNGALQL